jgi:tartrate-resistant acid phosphatase type 5
MTNRTRREVAVGLPALAGAMAVAWPQAKAAENEVAFLVVGDWGRPTAPHQRNVAAQMGRTANKINSQFVVSVGDNFYEDGVQTAKDPQWKTSYEDIYVAPSLQKPWYALLGNHDYGGVPQAQIDYAATSHRWRMPSRYYKVAGAEIGAPHLDLFLLDTTPLVYGAREKAPSAIAANVKTQDPAQQLAWLDRELGASTAAWKLVFGHHTIHSGGSAHGDTPELVTMLKPILERHSVQAYINGHEHDLQHIEVGPVSYICSGGGCEARPTGRIEGTRFARSVSGFAAIRVRAETLALEFRDYSGRSIYRTQLSVTSAARG